MIEIFFLPCPVYIINCITAVAKCSVTHPAILVIRLWCNSVNEITASNMATLGLSDLAVFLATLFIGSTRIEANPDAKRLYDDLLSNYNRLIRPVANNTDKITVRMGLKLSQLVDLVRITHLYLMSRILRVLRQDCSFKTSKFFIFWCKVNIIKTFCLPFFALGFML